VDPYTDLHHLTGHDLLGWCRVRDALDCGGGGGRRVALMVRRPCIGCAVPRGLFQGWFCGPLTAGRVKRAAE